jgi:hypothetical protein
MRCGARPSRRGCNPGDPCAGSLSLGPCRLRGSAFPACVACPVTSRVKGYPFEVPLPDGPGVSGVILADQIKSLDWKARRAEFASSTTDVVVNDAASLVLPLIEAEGWADKSISRFRNDRGGGCVRGATEEAPSHFRADAREGSFRLNSSGHCLRWAHSPGGWNPVRIRNSLRCGNW